MRIEDRDAEIIATVATSLRSLLSGPTGGVIAAARAEVEGMPTRGRSHPRVAVTAHVMTIAALAAVVRGHIDVHGIDAEALIASIVDGMFNLMSSDEGGR